ncbi:YHS domain-containing (seleno)protein [Bernardetia sp. ABR2-2B]|uniref:YHS domain-containing (seleno)protein n=1 Tax=Bernardetia sp. ABR2-2B TaxID=3127472 RepID=UPI0030D111A3
MIFYRKNAFFISMFVICVSLVTYSCTSKDTSQSQEAKEEVTENKAEEVTETPHNEVITEKILVEHLNLVDSLAVKGYDVVSYFTEEKPQEGKETITTTHLGATYRFATEENRDLFIESPEKYIPLYGGWCSYAMGAKNEKVPMDPQNYKIVDGDLHLFYKDLVTDTQVPWNEDEKNIKQKANENWSNMVSN